MTPDPIKQNLPVGIQDFPALIERGYLYVDKTEQIYSLITQGEVYFLSRPRRFGKSLLVSTLQAIFERRRELFKGLWIDQSAYDWPVHPVVRLDMSEIDTGSAAEFRASLVRRVSRLRTHFGLASTDIDSPRDALIELIEDLTKTSGQAVVLIDEYDKPLLDVMDDKEKLNQLREEVKQFYATLKSQQANLRFVFLTGVSKFSQVSVFSGLNNLIDVSFEPEFSSLLGYTQSELEHNFGPWINQLCEREKLTHKAILAKTKTWYNGYQFSEDATSVYNPFSTLLLFRTQRFKHHWYETRTFLTKWLARVPEEVLELEHCEVSATDFISMPMEEMELIPVLYQTGYLTIKSYEASSDQYVLSYPNDEVRTAFSNHLLKQMLSSSSWRREQVKLKSMMHCLLSKDYDGWVGLFNELLSCVPYSLHDKNEKYAKSIFYLAHLVGGLPIQAETHTYRGQTDVVIEVGDAVWIIEFKVDKTPKVAMGQIKAKDYHAKYYAQGKTVTLIGVNYSSKSRQVDGWLVESL